MGVTPQILTAKVTHKRLAPKINQFTYSVYYLALPLKQLDKANIVVDKFAKLSFYNKDHGNKDGSSLQTWASDILDKNNVQDVVNITLVTMPRIFGYVFNPVSFWLCTDGKQNLKAVITQVNNTFGESHTYLCLPNNGSNINSSDWLEADKLFHVSPFLEREGSYKFRFNITKQKLGIWIDYFDKTQNKQLLTSLIGDLQPLTPKALNKVFWRYPLITFKTMFLIHWQALKLFTKGVKYIVKPQQRDIVLSDTKK